MDKQKQVGIHEFNNIRLSIPIHPKVNYFIFISFAIYEHKLEYCVRTGECSILDFMYTYKCGIGH